jgi:hypothetical protein
MSERPWIARCRHFFLYIRGCGWTRPLRMRGTLFDIIGMPRPQDAWLESDNDNGAA